MANMKRGELDIPVSESQVTSEWLSVAMGVRGVELDELERLSLNNPVVSQLFRAYISFNGEPITVIVKIPSEREEHRLMCVGEGAYEREAGSYRLLERWHGGVVPRVLACVSDDETRTAALVLEDLGPPFKSEEAGQVGVESAEIVLERLAEIHAAYWNDPSIRTFGWMRPTESADLFGEPVDRFAPAWRNMLASAVQPVGRNARGLGDRLTTELGAVMGRLDARPQTLIHADLHQANLMFRHRDPTDPMIIDWQNSASCGATSDVAKFLATSLQASDLAEHETSILRTYHAALMDGGVEDYSFARLIADYRLAQLVTLANYVIANYTPDSGPDVPETSSPSLRAVLAAVDATGEMP